MRLLAKSMVALGMLGAMAIGTSAPASAQGFSVQVPGFEFGIGQPYYGGAYQGWAYEDPRILNRRLEVRPQRFWNDPRRGMNTWDSYGLRWD